MSFRVLPVFLIVFGSFFFSRPVRAGEELPSSSGKVVSPAPPDTREIKRKLDAIQLPAMEFRDVPFRQAVGRLHQAAAKADMGGDDGKTRGVNMVIKLAEEDGPGGPVTVTFNAGSLRQALTTLAAAAKLKIALTPHAAGFVPADEFTDLLVTKEYSSPGRRFASADRAAKSGPAKKLLESNGVAFPPGAGAWLTADGKLVVRNSEENLKAVEEFLDGKPSGAVR